MTVRRTLPFLLAALLGVGAALLAACGSNGDGRIPAASASDLKREIGHVRKAVEGDRCADVSGQLRQVDEGIDDLPPTVDDQLPNSLRDGVNRLLSAARDECDDTPTETTTETTETVPEETTTETAPTETETTPPPPSGTPGGGVEPEIP